jgi:hypothetical protein
MRRLDSRWYHIAGVVNKKTMDKTEKEWKKKQSKGFGEEMPS